MRIAAALVVLVLARVSGAQEWTPLPGPAGARFVSVSPARPRLVFASGDAGLYSSSNGGLSWTPRTKGLPAIEGDCYGVKAAAFNPDRPRVVRVGLARDRPGYCSTGSVVFESRGPGRRWNPIFLQSSGVGGVSALTGAPGDVLWVGTTRGGILKLPVRPGPWQTVWYNDDEDLGITALALHPRDPDVMHAATKTRGIIRTTDGGATWTWINQGLPRFDDTGASSPTGAFVFTVPLVRATDDADTLHVGTLGYGSCCPEQVGVGGDVFTSRDGGTTWTGSAAGLGGVNVLSLVSDPVRAATVYAGTTDGVFRSADRGVTWQPFGLQGATVWSLATPGDGSALYAATGAVHRRPL